MKLWEMQCSIMQKAEFHVAYKFNSNVQPPNRLPIACWVIGKFLASINNVIHNFFYFGIWMDPSPDLLQKEYLAYSLHTIKVQQVQ